jgi:hypothetical protein
MMSFMECYCEICNVITEQDWICDRCESFYCEDCSYSFTIHYQFQGSRCYQCAEQSRRNPLTIPNLRENSIKYILNQVIKDYER